MAHQFTPDEISELARCVDTPSYFAQLVPANVDYEALRRMHKSRFVLLDCDPITPLVYLLHQICFRQYCNVALLTPKHVHSAGPLATIKMWIAGMPDHLRPKMIVDRKHWLELENGNKVHATSINSSSTCGRAFNIFYLDQFASVETERAEHFFMSIYPCISSTKTYKAIVRRGRETYWDKLWNESEAHTRYSTGLPDII
jgi:hypothetical protein